ncbi:MAG: LPS-assembly protein LptD, partial [Alistipes sp.]|nr:LPS-assembly protein LptD [Candidatus Minthomonas equi]
MLPFGFVPSRPERAGGILFPTFGEEEARGFYLQDGGFYFTIGDYADIALTGSYFTLGSYNAKLTSRYNVRYKFSGSLNINYSNDQIGERNTPEFMQTTNFGVQWSHSQDSKAHPGTSFRASVNFSSPSNSRFNERTVQAALTNQTSSSISWSKTWQKASLSVNALHSQNSRDSSYVITFPNITFSLNRFYPFKKKERVGKQKWYEEFALSYNTQMQNKINFKTSDFSSEAGFNFLEKLQSGMSHRFTIGLPSITLFKYVNVSPSINYGMNWFFQSNSKYYNPDTDRVEDIRTDQFGDFGITQDFSAGMSASTRIYGTFVAKGGGKLKAVRHVITPSLSVSWRPEHGTTINGYQVYSYLDNNGAQKSLEYNKWSGGMNSVPSKGQSASLSFSIGNNLEAKVADPKDTTGTGTKKIKLIDQLNISGSYNFMADSMKLSTIGVSMNTNVLEKVGIHGNLTLDPYAINERGVRINQFNIAREGGFKLARITNAGASFSFNISGEGKTFGYDGASEKGGNSAASGQKDGSDVDKGHNHNGNVSVGTDASPYMKVYYDPYTGEYIPGGWVYYMNTNAPWSLNFNYNLSYSKSYSYTNNQLITKNNITQTLGVAAQMKLTRDFSINLNTGFDFTQMKLSTTQLSATYDLHCFAITFSYVPSGKWAQWNFRIAAKASALSDLLQYKKAS